MMPQLSLGVVGTSRKPRRASPRDPPGASRADRAGVARSHPRRARLRQALRRRRMRSWRTMVGGLRSREELLEEADIVLLPKPVPEDLTLRPAGSVLWGWPHCVQDEAMTQIAIDRRLTLIAWEAMNHWTQRRQLQPARLPQEQRAGRLLLGPARAAARRDDRRLRAAPARGRDQLRRHRPRRGHRAVRAGRARRRRCSHTAASPRSRRRWRRRGSSTTSAIPDDPSRDAAARRAGPGVGRRVPRRARRHRQLHPPGHRRAARCSSPSDELGRFRARQPVHRRLLRRGHGLRVGAADVVRRSDVHGRRPACATTRSTTARRTCGTPPPGRSARR